MKPKNLTKEQRAHVELLEQLIEQVTFELKGTPPEDRADLYKRAREYTKEYFTMTGRGYVVKGAYDTINES